MTWAALFLLLLAAFLGLTWVLSERLRHPMGSAARASAPGKFAELSQGVTHYRWSGPLGGPVAVCVHGLTSASYVWDPVVRALNMMGFRVLRYDLYGRGFSDRPPGVQDRDFFLQQLRDLLEDQGIVQVDMMVGYSMGGSIATAFTAEDPGRVLRLVLLAPAGLGLTPGRLAGFARRVPLLGDWVMRVVGGLWLRHTAARQPASDDGIARKQIDETRFRGYLGAVLSSQRNMLAEDQEADHRRIAKDGLPVLAVWGEEDAVIPLSALGRMAQVNRAARQVTLSGATHALPFTHPDEIHAELQTFLREV